MMVNDLATTAGKSPCATEIIPTAKLNETGALSGSALSNPQTQLEIKLSGMTLLSADDLENVPQECLPMPVLSDNVRSFLSWGIKAHEKGAYNHFMWMIHPDMLASQNFLYQSQSVKDYVSMYRLKLWYCKAWTPEQREGIIKAIEANLNKPWYKRLYNVVAILGQLFKRPEIRFPGLEICSDKGKFLKLYDPSYDLYHPDPEEVNHWMEKYPEHYAVYGRYVPD
jgi:hypothetical protein